MGLVDTEVPWVDDARQPTSTPTRERQPDADGFTVQDGVHDPTSIGSGPQVRVILLQVSSIGWKR
jgi:hypothetical protein